MSVLEIPTSCLQPSWACRRATSSCAPSLVASWPSIRGHLRAASCTTRCALATAAPCTKSRVPPWTTSPFGSTSPIALQQHMWRCPGSSMTRTGGSSAIQACITSHQRSSEQAADRLEHLQISSPGVSGCKTLAKGAPGTACQSQRCIM